MVLIFMWSKCRLIRGRLQLHRQNGCTLGGRFRGRVEVEFPVEAPWSRME